jgi:hypothetical protein
MSEHIVLSLLKHPDVERGELRVVCKEDLARNRFVDGAVIVLLAYRLDGYGKLVDKEDKLIGQEHHSLEVIGVDDRGFVGYRYIGRKSALAGVPSVPMQSLLESQSFAYLVQCSKAGETSSADVLPFRRTA